VGLLGGSGWGGRAGRELGRPDAARQRGRGARGRSSLARQAPLGYRLSRQGYPPRGETLVSAGACLRAGSRALIVLLAGAVVALAAPAARAMTIERVVSPGGIEAWLVSDRTLPLIAVEFAFLGGADQDPLDKPGIAEMATSLFDEGAGPFDASAFHDRLERRAIELSFRTGRDYLRGSLRTLSETRDEAFDALRLALSEPRFDPAAVERERAAIMARLRRETLNPNDMANRTWWATAVPRHPYGLPGNRTPQTGPKITI